MLREDRLGTAQADFVAPGTRGGQVASRFDVVGGITGLIQGVLVTNVFVTTQGRAVVLTWASVGLSSPLRHRFVKVLFARRNEVMTMAKLMHQDDTGLDALDPATSTTRDGSHFRAIVAARKTVEQADEDLRAAVKAARDAGDTWATIGLALDTTRQAAYQRFGQAES